MRKLIILISLLMVLVFTSTVFAKGMIYDYREFYPPLADGTIIYKPLANFAIDVKSPSGEIKTSVATEHNDGADLGPAPSIKAQVGDTLVFTDRSSSQSGYKIAAWDWQWWREDQPTEEYNLKSRMDRQLLLEVPGRYHFYLCVADNAPVVKGDSWLWDLNWSDNGKHRAIKNLGNGLQGYWYFNEIIVEVAEGAPDFYPTPEGSTQWQESYKTCARTYYYDPGQTEITFPVNLFNQGIKAKTDFRAVWYGQGDDPDTGWQGKNPPWQAGELVELDNDQSKTWMVTVPLPQEGQPNKLVFKCNIDGKTPETEDNLDNNIMVIQFSTGVDLAVKLTAHKTSYNVWEGNTVTPTVMLKTWRKDDGSEPVNAKLTWTTPEGTRTKEIIFTPGYSEHFPVMFSTGKQGTYTISAEVWPEGIKEIYPPDNTDKVTIQVIVAVNAYKDATDPGTRTGIKD